MNGCYDPVRIEDDERATKVGEGFWKARMDMPSYTHSGSNFARTPPANSADDLGGASPKPTSGDALCETDKATAVVGGLGGCQEFDWVTIGHGTLCSKKVGVAVSSIRAPGGFLSSGGSNGSRGRSCSPRHPRPPCS